MNKEQTLKQFLDERRRNNKRQETKKKILCLLDNVHKYDINFFMENFSFTYEQANVFFDLLIDLDVIFDFLILLLNKNDNKDL